MSHQQTIAEIKSELAKDEFVIDVLRDKFKGKTALIISAGPSAENWREIYKKEKHNDPVIICIKQTINLIDIPCDIHFVNSGNLIKYKYQPNTLSIMTRNSKAAPIFGSYDVKFQIMEDFLYKHEYYLATNECFECYELDKTGTYRPLGPGIMHESVFHTLVHFGFKRIVTIGWDVADSKGSNSHVGAKSDGHLGSPYQPSHSKLLVELWLKKLYLFGFYKKIGFTRRQLKEAIRFFSGKRINWSGMEKGEAELTSSSIPELINWLEKKEIKLEINSNSKWMNSKK
jgi:hypothetical protein